MRGPMIKVDGLTKIYKSKKKDKCVALDNVSFSLGDKGFVFIVGKSGSGKTTLLSIIGGLDNLTAGDVEFNGNSFATFKERDFVDYRNSMIGYIFQDFHLIDELTIFENIKLALDLQRQNDDEGVKRILDKVGLSGYENRYPKELSGGEKQRIAIARALIKNPRIILADEPTGNLDSKTTAQIMTLLKELSKETLVLIVSHSLSDAREYADRIIELSAGKIINDLKRNEHYDNKVKMVDGELFVPAYKEFDEEDNNLIAENVKEGRIKKITQVNDIFVDNDKKDFTVKVEDKIESKGLSCKNLLKLATKFLKKDVVRLVIYSFVVACLVMILGLSQLIVNFDSSRIIEDELSQVNQSSISLYKETVADGEVSVNKGSLIPILDEDIAKFYEGGYEGNVYELVNVVLDYGTSYKLAEDHLYNTPSFGEVYFSGTRGTLVTTEEYIAKVFGKVEYLALADTIEAGGIYITDYTADAMLFYRDNPSFVDYQSLLGHHKCMNVNVYAYVNGIIKTGYKDKHKSVMDKIADPNTTKDELRELATGVEYRAYYDDIVQHLSISYTTNPKFKEDVITLNAKTWVPMPNAEFVKDGKKFKIDRYFENAVKRSDHVLQDNEIVMSMSLYNTIFNTNYNASNLDQFVPVDVQFHYYHAYDIDKTNAVHVANLTITKLVEGNSIYVSEPLFLQLTKINNFTSALYFDDVSNVGAISDVAVKNGFTMNSITAMAISTVTKAVDVFSDFFNIIFVGLCLCAALILVAYGLRLVKGRKYEIGILKALGARNIELAVIFGLQIIIAAVLIVVLYVLGAVVFTDVANSILIKSLAELAPNDFIIDIKILALNPIDILKNSALVVGIVLVSFILPIIKLRVLKPLDIVKAKE